MLVAETATHVGTVGHQALILAASEFERSIGHIMSLVLVIDCVSSILHPFIKSGELFIDFILGLTTWPIDALD